MLSASSRITSLTPVLCMGVSGQRPRALCEAAGCEWQRTALPEQLHCASKALDLVPDYTNATVV